MIKGMITIGAIGIATITILATAFFGFAGWTTTNISDNRNTIIDIGKTVIKNETNVANIYTALDDINSKLDILIRK